MDLKDRVLHVMTTYVGGCVVPLFLNIRPYVEVRGYRNARTQDLWSMESRHAVLAYSVLSITAGCKYVAAVGHVAGRDFSSRRK
jgi:hypothetical protein